MISNEDLRKLNDTIISFYTELINEYNAINETKIKIISNIDSHADSVESVELVFDFIDTDTNEVYLTYDVDEYFNGIHMNTSKQDMFDNLNQTLYEQHLEDYYLENDDFFDDSDEE